MEDEKMKQLQKQFNKVYLDTTKHCQDIEKWIKSGNRKQGDIRRSLERLKKKYENLSELRTELEKSNITEQEVLSNITNHNHQMNLTQIDNKINDLYKLAGLEKNIKYKYNVDLIEEIPQTQDFNVPKIKRKLKYNNIDLITDIQNNNKINMPVFLEEEKSLKIKIKQKFQKIKNKISNFKKSNKENTKSKGRLAKRVAALGMALTMGLFSTTTAGESKYEVNETGNTKSYTDTNHENNKFKESMYIQALESTKEAETTANEIGNAKNEENVNKSTGNSEKNKKENKKTIEDNGEEVFLVHADTKYTEVSDGSGESGYFSKDKKIKIYNRALIKTCEDGSKSILKATKVGQTWKQFAEEKGIDYEEFRTYIDNNENIEECVSVQSEDGKTLYGWLSINELEVENMEEIER